MKNGVRLLIAAARHFVCQMLTADSRRLSGT
jgi:hypothetical protein